MRFNTKNGMFFHPESEENEDLRLVLDNGSEDIFVVKHGLKIPQEAENYKDFCKKMKNSENEFRKLVV